MSDPGEGGRPAQRVVVTSPRTRAARVRRAQPAVPVPLLSEESDLSTHYVRSLIKEQRRLGLLVCGVVCGSLAALPLLFALAPRLGEQRLLGLPLPWLVLGVLVFPVLVLAGWFYVWQAERSEREFAELVERP
ncbi:DUF485 domain-containing protein [Umezawaea beigongshangensis]|uniref:DUF485 domain-containing protein n=1 Tax=Umezawaea beigongshangensis TaxID=2780383 RepID=UPI0018F25A58|nr:DUF485 domain-containing protein [Umezawaea beigongshangensis]